MSIYIPFNKDNSRESQDLRSSADNFRSGLNGLLKHLAIMNSGLTNQQITDRYGFYPSTVGGTDQANQAGLFKTELASDLGKLQTDAQQTNVLTAINQLLTTLG